MTVVAFLLRTYIIT